MAGITPSALKEFVRAEYDAAAPGWDRDWASHFGPPAERLVEQLNPAPGNRCLDLACGSGLVARAFATRVGPALVTAVDLSSLQVEHARRALADAGLADVRLEVQDAERLGFAPASFERVGCGFGISHFPRPIVALRGVFRILSPGGRAGFTVWGPWSRDLGFRLDRLLVRIVPALESLPVRPEDEALDRVVEQNSQPGRLDAMLRAAGFERVRHRVHTLVVHHPDAASFVDASLAGYEADFDALELDADARAGIRARLMKTLAENPHHAVVTRRRFDTLVARKPA
jgi:ubiquinone/menaquinone biosynthesis C-methylase UbiE